MATAAFDLRLDVRRFNGSVREFMATHLPAAIDKIIRKAAFDVVGAIVRSLNGEEAGFAAPKRIDTGRYRAGWSVSVKDVWGRAGGPTSVGTSRAGQKGQAQPGVGSGKLIGPTLKRRVTLTNAVEYGPHIEFGTSRMRPGHHVKLALASVRAEIKKLAREQIVAAGKR